MLGIVNSFNIIIPELVAEKNEYLSAPINLIGFLDGDVAQALGLNTPKIIPEVFKENILEEKADEILKKAEKKKNVDALFN